MAERVRGIIDAWFGVLGERPDQWRMLTSATSSDPQVQASVERVESMQLRNDITMVRAFLPHLPEAEVEPIAEAIRGSLVAIGTWWLAHLAVDRSVPVGAMTRLCTGLLATTTLDETLRRNSKDP